MPIFHLQFEAIPTADSADFEDCGGAFINCWVLAESEQEALEQASHAVRENLWTVVSVSEECGEVLESDYAADDEEMEYFQNAINDGECYVYHQWPNESQAKDDVH